MHGFDIQAYLCLLLSYLERITVPRKENITAQILKGKRCHISHNKISEVWAFLFQNLAK